MSNILCYFCFVFVWRPMETRGGMCGSLALSRFNTPFLFSYFLFVQTKRLVNLSTCCVQVLGYEERAAGCALWDPLALGRGRKRKQEVLAPGPGDKLCSISWVSLWLLWRPFPEKYLKLSLWNLNSESSPQTCCSSRPPLDVHTRPESTCFLPHPIQQLVSPNLSQKHICHVPLISIQ